MPASWLRFTGNGLQLALHVQPGAGRDEPAGLHGDRLRLRIKAPPVEGKANKHLQGWLAEQFGVPRGNVALVSGARGRRKNVFIKSPKRFPDWFQTLAPDP